MRDSPCVDPTFLRSTKPRRTKHGLLNHPRLAEWLDFVKKRLTRLNFPRPSRRVFCCSCVAPGLSPIRSRPSHQADQPACLLDSGFFRCDAAALNLPQGIAVRRLTAGFSPEVLNLIAARQCPGTVIHRMVISEPMAVVPYEHIANSNGKSNRPPSPAPMRSRSNSKMRNAVSPCARISSCLSGNHRHAGNGGDEETLQLCADAQC